MFEKYVTVDGKIMRCGYTTGSSATAVTVAGLRHLLFNEKLNVVRVKTPKGIDVDIEIIENSRVSNYVITSCYKDGGDDPDATNGAKISAKVEVDSSGEITILGGKGVGVVTKKGLDQPVGNHAINSTPRRMIKATIEEILKEKGNENLGVKVTISVENGEEIAKKTFNERLGIIGGISILGTTGIVEPMSDSAIIKTIEVEINQKVVENNHYILITPGNYGKNFLFQNYNIDDKTSVKCSNFIGDTIDILKSKKAKGFLLVAHIGKLIKLYNNVFNTHSKYGDGRKEAFIDACGSLPMAEEVVLELSEAVMTDDMLDILKKHCCYDVVLDIIIKKIVENIKARSKELEFGVIGFSNSYGVLTHTENALEILKKIAK